MPWCLEGTSIQKLTEVREYDSEVTHKIEIKSRRIECFGRHHEEDTSRKWK